MTKQSEVTRALLMRFFEAMSSGDHDALMEFLTEESTWYVRAVDMPGSGPHTGSAIKDAMRATRPAFKRPPHIEIFRMIVSDDWAAVQTYARGDLVNGAAYNNEYAFFVNVRDGKIQEMHEYLDTSYTVANLLPLLDPGSV